MVGQKLKNKIKEYLFKISYSTEENNKFTFFLNVIQIWYIWATL